MVHDPRRNAASALLDRPGIRPESTVVSYEGRTLSHGDIRRDCARFANLLVARGFVPGDRLAIALPDTPAFIAALYGSLLAGACPMVLPWDIPADTCGAILAETGARGVAAQPDSEAMRAADARGCTPLPCGDLGPPELPDMPPDCHPVPSDGQEQGFILFTSGSTGRPKGVVHRPGDLLAACESAADIMGLTPSDAIYSVARFSSLYGLIPGLGVPLLTGASIVLTAAKPPAAELFAFLARHGVTVFYGTPAVYRMMLGAARPERNSIGLRYCYSAGESLSADLHAAWVEAVGVEIVDGIGSTEACSVYLSNRPGSSRPGSVGRPAPGFAVRLTDEAGRDVFSGEPGRLLVRGPCTASRYLGLPELSSRTMLEGGWLATGDIAREEDGWYVFLGRSDDMLKVCGEWVSPLAVEAALREHPGVADCAVTGTSMAGGTWVMAFVVAHPPAGADTDFVASLREHARQRLPRHMRPVDYALVPTLPRAPGGKVRRAALRLEAAKPQP